MTTRSLLLLGLALLFATAGCDSQSVRPTVRGSVSCKGSPTPYQTLTLHPVDAQQKFMRRIYLDEKGKFEGDAPAPGEYKVTIEPPMAALEGGKDIAGAEIKLPAKYRQPETTDLRWEIKPGVNERDFVLTE